MMKELESDEPYEVASGCPTITFDLEGESLMLAYSSFVSGSFKGDRIELIFQEWRVEIEGENLGEVWKLLQMQDVRGLKLSTGKCASTLECQIRIIVAKRLATKKSWI
jgi:hypothetical protein